MIKVRLYLYLARAVARLYRSTLLTHIQTNAIGAVNATVDGRPVNINCNLLVDYNLRLY
jgi:hypothetical protein